MGPHMPRPGQARIGAQHIDLGFSAVLAQDKAHILRRSPIVRASAAGAGPLIRWRSGQPRRISGARACKRDEPSESKSPRLLSSMACNSSRMTQRSPANISGASSWDGSAGLSGLSSACAAVSCADADAWTGACHGAGLGADRDISSRVARLRWISTARAFRGEM